MAALVSRHLDFESPLAALKPGMEEEFNPGSNLALAPVLEIHLHILVTPDRSKQNQTQNQTLTNRPDVLADRARHGSPDAMRELVSIFQPTIERYMRQRVQHEDDRQDCIAIALGKIPRLIKSYERPADRVFEKLVSRMMHRVLIDRARRSNGLIRIAEQAAHRFGDAIDDSEPIEDSLRAPESEVSTGFWRAAEYFTAAHWRVIRLMSDNDSRPSFSQMKSEGFTHDQFAKLLAEIRALVSEHVDVL